jgi:hypothetical protein
MQTKHLLIIFCAIVLSLFSCKKETEIAPINNNSNNNASRQATSPIYKQDALILGQKLKNPYTVQNMLLAANAIRKEFSMYNVNQIKTTHLYVKFKPANESQYERLASDTNYYNL